MQESLSKLLPEIYSHVAKEAPREGCGIIIDGPKFIPLDNIVKKKITLQSTQKNSSSIR